MSNFANATVVAVLDPYRVVINRGSSDGIQLGHRFIVYGLSDKPVFDPESGKDLGHIEIVRGTGKVIHVQETMATLRSDMYTQSKRVIRRNNTPFKSVLSPFGSEEETTVGEPVHESFDEVGVRDRARFI